MKTGSLRRLSGNVVEFPMVLIILLLVIACPLIDLIGTEIGATICYLSVRQSVNAAATQPNYGQSLKAMRDRTMGFLKTPWARFLHLTPVRGYQNCGVNLYVDATKLNPNATVEYGPNTPLPPPIDTSGTIYVCTARGTFSVSPLLDLQSVPWVGSVPGLGKPVHLEFTVDRAAEYPIGLAISGAPTGINLAMPPAFNTVPSAPSSNQGVNNSGWTNPQIYLDIASAGRTVVQQNVVYVPANGMDWTQTGIDVVAGDQVWLDTQADGGWTFDFNATSADGNTSHGAPHGYPMGALVGQLGHGDMFVLGIQSNNLAPPGSGPLRLVANSNSFVFGWGYSTFNDQHTNTGGVTVRVIVTQ